MGKGGNKVGPLPEELETQIAMFLASDLTSGFLVLKVKEKQPLPDWCYHGKTINQSTRCEPLVPATQESETGESPELTCPRYPTPTSTPTQGNIARPISKQKLRPASFLEELFLSNTPPDIQEEG